MREMAINLLPLILASQIDTTSTIILEPVPVTLDSNKKLEEKVETSSFKGSFHGKIGKPWGYGLDFLIGNNIGQVKTELCPYLNININGNGININENAVIGFRGSAFTEDLKTNINGEVSREEFNKIDTTRTSEYIVAPIQNGISWKEISQEDITHKKIKENGYFFGAGINFGKLEKNNKVLIQVSNSNSSITDKTRISQTYDEIYRDSTYTEQGEIIVVTNTDLFSRILTENNALISIKQNINKWRFSYEHDLNEKIRAGIGAALQNHSIEADIRNITDIESYLNGLSIVKIIANQVYVDTIPISDYKESQQYSRILDKEQTNTDLLSLILHLNKDKNPNYRAVFDKAFFNSRDWGIKQIFNCQAGSWLGSLGININNSSFGGQLFWAKQFYTSKAIREFSNYIYDKEELQRDFALNELQKQIKQKYEDLNFLKQIYGIYGLVSLERIGGSDGDWRFDSELGYNIGDGRQSYFGIAGYFNAYRKRKEVGTKLTFDDVTGKVYFSWDDGTKIGAELTFNQ